MSGEQRIDFRAYRPAAAVSIDLVKHTGREEHIKAEARRMIANRLEAARSQLNLTDFKFNFTGDGYLCALLGDSSSRLMDFVNLVFPFLEEDLRGLAQPFRAGIDFGLLHLQHDRLTGSPEHFGTPGILATRLQAAGSENQILSTAGVHHVFADRYGRMFKSGPISIQTKDRPLTAYELRPINLSQFHSKLGLRLYGQDLLEPARRPGGKILIVEDEDEIAHLMREVLAGFITMQARDGEQALRMVEREDFDLVLMDIGLPRMDGITASRTLHALHSRLPIVIVSGKGTMQDVEEAFSIGVRDYLVKPFANRVLLARVLAVLGEQDSAIMRDAFLLSDSGGQLLLHVDKLGERVQLLVKSFRGASWHNTFLRHKLKRCVDEYVRSFIPGNDVIAAGLRLGVQLSFLERLNRVALSAARLSLSKYFVAVVEDARKVYPSLSVKLTIDAALDLINLAEEHQVLLALIATELIDNSIDAIGREGSLSITADRLTSKGEFRLTVSDSGPGFAPQIATSAFHEGVSTKGPGRGLGLYWVKEALGRMSGRVEIADSLPTMVSITVPVI